jgi:hypothetical protein
VETTEAAIIFNTKMEKEKINSSTDHEDDKKLVEQGLTYVITGTELLL